MVPSRLHGLHESKIMFVSLIEIIRSKLSISSAHVSWVTDRLAAVLSPHASHRPTSTHTL